MVCVKHIGNKLVDPDIDPHEVLATIEPKIRQIGQCQIPYFKTGSPLTKRN